jgi:hypothetical protein
MPATDKQAKFMQLALAVKEGKVKPGAVTKKLSSASKSMSKSDLKDFTHKEAEYFLIGYLS